MLFHSCSPARVRPHRLSRLPPKVWELAAVGEADHVVGEDDEAPRARSMARPGT